jgi:hypothetical protein
MVLVGVVSECDVMCVCVWSVCEGAVWCAYMCVVCVCKVCAPAGWDYCPVHLNSNSPL